MSSLVAQNLTESNQNITNLTAEMSNQTFTSLYDVIDPKEKGESQDFVSITRFITLHLSLQFTNVFYTYRYLLEFWFASMPFIYWEHVSLDQWGALHLTLQSLTLPKKKEPLLIGLKWNPCNPWYK